MSGETEGEEQMISPRRGILTAAALCATAMLMAIPAVAADPAWQPSRNVEIGALDAVSRIFQRVLQEQKMLPTSVSVANKAGGGNAVGFAYLASRAGDGNTLLVTPFTI